MITMARHPTTAGGGHEPDVVHMRAILWFALGLILTVVATQGSVYAFHRFLARGHPGAPAAQPSGVDDFASSGHWLTPREDLARLRAQEDDRLNAYGWVDESHTTARIPISKAMELYVQRAIPPSSNPQPK